MGRRTLPILLLFLLLFSTVVYAYEAPIIVDHSHTDITRIPQTAIEQAKTNLHIVYGHTSHGSQLTTGMTGLVAFANNGGLGLSLPTDIFAYNNGGTNGALDLHDGGMGGDVGYYPTWVNNTRNYLSNNPDVNVVIWSWCGQVDGKYANGTLHSEYLDPMNQLELDYPDVMFVYMTGHVDIWDDANNKAANQVIRDYCNANNKILYDFADIERYDPDGNYYEFVSDTCNYYERAGGSAIGNWATEWQNSHTEGVHWYECYSAHSQPLNANRKAYAAWWLWARLGGWDGGNNADDHTLSLTDVIQSLQVTSAMEPDGITVVNDVDGDTRIGLAEAISALGKLRIDRGMKMWKAESSSDPYHAWGTDQVVGNQAKEQEVIQDFLHYKVRRLYASYNKTQSEIAAWNRQLSNAGVESYVTIGSSSYDNGIFPGQRGVILDAIDAQLLSFNNNYASTDTERFTGVRLNLEPQRMDEWDNGTAADRRQLLLYLLETFNDVRAHLDANNGSNLKIFADIGHYFDKMPDPDPANGKVGWTSEQERDQWFSDLSQVLDTVIVMAYGLSVSSIERTTAYERGAMTNAELALNVKDVVSIGTGEDIWQDLDEFIQALEQVEADLGIDTSIHSYRYLKHLSLQ